jgi:hypothetical protein
MYHFNTEYWHCPKRESYCKDEYHYDEYRNGEIGYGTCLGITNADYAIQLSDENSTTITYPESDERLKFVGHLKPNNRDQNYETFF